MKIKQLLAEGTQILKNNNIEKPIMHARLLLEFILEKNREYLLVNENNEVEEMNKDRYLESIERLADGEPIQYITKHQEFMKLGFYVDNNVLIPRADTEILVEEAINLINNLKKTNLKVLDMCTGSGAIAVSIAKYIENVEVYGVDISEKALEVARRNAEKNKVEKKCNFINSDMFKNILDEFDIIISNPPYIKRKKIKELDKNVKREPIMALDGGENGLEFYERLAAESHHFLKKNGILLLEIGYDQKIEVVNILESTEKYYNIYSKKDLAQNDRIVVATKK